MPQLAVVHTQPNAITQSTARQALSDHLGHVAAAQERYDALRTVWDRMQQGKDNEARCRSVLQTQITCEEEAMKAWAANPQGPMPQADAFARECNEGALANARRIADTIRAAEPEHSARQTQSVRTLDQLRSQTPALVHAVMVEDAANIKAELEGMIAAATAKAAQLFGLRNYLAEQGAHDTSGTVPLDFEMQPTAPAIIGAQNAWQAYAARLAASPQATMKE